MENECEEDCEDLRSSNRSKSDFDHLEYDEAMDMLKSKFDVEKEMSSIGTKDDQMSKFKMTALPTEYTEYNGSQLITTTGAPYPNNTMAKPRRKRKDRKGLGAKSSNTGTTSSSGIAAGGTAINTSIYDYNSNQLTAQYGNNI